MRKSIALFGCLALLGAAPVGTAHAQSSHTTSAPGPGIMPGNGSTESTGPEGNYDDTITGSTTPIGSAKAKAALKKHRQQYGNPMDDPDAESGIGTPNSPSPPKDNSGNSDRY